MQKKTFPNMNERWAGEKKGLENEEKITWKILMFCWLCQKPKPKALFASIIE